MHARLDARGSAFARLSLLGNPSDGFGGRTLSVTIRDFSARVRVRASDTGGAGEGGRRLLEATRARFERSCLAGDAAGGWGALELETDIPLQVGLGGSSAIVIAGLRALCAAHDLDLAPSELAEIALAVETEDLGIPAGPQDRVVQAHEGLVYMDFGREAAGEPYQVLDPSLLPALFVAYDPRSGQASGGVHAELRRRFELGDAATRSSLEEIAGLARDGRDRLLEGDRQGFGELLGRNLAARSRLIELEPRHLRMVEIAAKLGAPANFAGSGGAIVGVLPAGARGGDLSAAFAAEGYASLRPAVG